MEGMVALQSVVDRLFEWFSDVPRGEVVRILREEAAQYQQRLRSGEVGPSAEHLAYQRLRVIVGGASR